MVAKAPSMRARTSTRSVVVARVLPDADLLLAHQVRRHARPIRQDRRSDRGELMNIRPIRAFDRPSESRL